MRAWIFVSAICLPCMVIICHFFGIDSDATSLLIVAEGIINDSRTLTYIFSAMSVMRESNRGKGCVGGLVR